MISDVKVWPLKNQNFSIKANGSFLVNEAFQLKFTLIQGSKGLFVGFPGKYGDKLDEKTGKKVWYSDVKCLKEDVHAELTATVLKVYNEKTGNTLDQGEAEGPSNQEGTDNIPY